MTAPSATVFPGAIDYLQAPQITDNLGTLNVEHDLLHDVIGGALTALETKVGITSSVDVTSVDYILAHHQHQGAGVDKSAQFSAIPIKMVASQVPNPLEVRTSTSTLLSAITPAGEFLDIGALATSLAYRAYVAGDTVDRWKVQADGKTIWGPGGSGAMDSYLYRVGVGQLRIDNNLGIGMSPVNTLDVTGSGRISGQFIANTGVDVRSGQTGPGTYFGEVRFGAGDTTSLTGGQGYGLSSMYTGSPRMYFDHRGTANTGDWQWRNGTAGASTQMMLSNVGTLALYGNGGYLDLSAVSATDGSAGTNVGDKIALYGGSSVIHYGFGVQSSRLVAYVPSGSMFAVRQDAASGQMSSGPNDAVTLKVDGTVAARSGQTYDPVRMEAANARLWTQGDQSGIAGANTAAATRYLIGLRSDITGNTDDLLFYAYTGKFRFFNTTEQLSIATDGKLALPNMALTYLVTTVGAAGGAAALPANPVGYLVVSIRGTDRKIPYYNV